MNRSPERFTLAWLIEGVKIVWDWYCEEWLPPYGACRGPSKLDLYAKMAQERKRAERED